MIITFFDRNDETNELSGTVIRDKRRLLQILQDMRGRPPSCCELIGENGFDLLVGVGENGCAQYSRHDGRPPYLMAVSADHAAPDADIEFLVDWTGTPVSTRFCMPFDIVMEIARYFMETGRAHPDLAWESI